MNQSPQSLNPEELKNLETDPVWTLLDQASQQKASPEFVNSVMNEITSGVHDHVVTLPSFWQRYSLPISAAAVAGIAACVVLMFSSEKHSSEPLSGISQSETDFSDEDYAFIEQQMQLEESNPAATEIDLFAEQMKEIKNEDPFIMTAEEINILVTL